MKINIDLKKSNEGRVSGANSRSGGESKGQLYCFKCYNMGHKRNDCPFGDELAKQSREVLKEQVEPIIKPRLTASFAHPLTLLESSNVFTVSQATKPWETTHVYSGLLKQSQAFKPVAVLRDTGSAVHAVHEQFVSADQYLPGYQKLITFGGTCERFKLAKIEVDTPFISGPITACVLSEYPEQFRYYDILIGNGGVLGSPVAKNPDSELIDAWNGRQTEIFPCKQVETRSCVQKKTEVGLNTILLDLNLSHSEIISFQRNDASLAKYYALIGKSPKPSKSDNIVDFKLVNGVLVRVFTSQSREVS